MVIMRVYVEIINVIVLEEYIMYVLWVLYIN